MAQERDIRAGFVKERALSSGSLVEHSLCLILVSPFPFLSVLTGRGMYRLGGSAGAGS